MSATHQRQCQGQGSCGQSTKVHWVLGLALGPGHLVLLAGALAVLCQSLQRLRDQVHVGFVDVKAKQAQPPCRASTHDVQKLQGLTHQVVVGLVVLTAQEVLEKKKR